MTPLRAAVVAFMTIAKCATTTQVARSIGCAPASAHRVLRALERRRLVKCRRGVHRRWPGRSVRQWAVPAVQFSDVDGVDWIPEVLDRRGRS